MEILLKNLYIRVKKMFISNKNKTTFLSENEAKLILLLKDQGMYDDLLELYGSDKEIIKHFMRYRKVLISAIMSKARYFN